MPTAALRGIEIHFERTGDGPPLLFLNGSGATLETTAPLLAPYAKHFELVAHDQRGLITCGRYDGIAPPSNSEAIAARVPGAELRFYEGGLAFPFQDRAALPDIIEFLARG